MEHTLTCTINLLKRTIFLQSSQSTMYLRTPVVSVVDVQLGAPAVTMGHALLLHSLSEEVHDDVELSEVEYNVIIR